MSALARHPRLAELVARRTLRAKVERAVERLIAVLDELDGDPDREDGVDAEAVNEDGGDINDDVACDL